jgi:hypothetical protein
MIEADASRAPEHGSVPDRRRAGEFLAPREAAGRHGVHAVGPAVSGDEHERGGVDSPIAVRIQWPWLCRERIADARLMTQHPTGNVYSSDYGIQPRKRRPCSAHIIVRGVVGGTDRKKPMRVTIGVQDHAGRWHKLVCLTLRDPAASR